MHSVSDPHSLMDEVLARENLIRAWKRVHANKGAPGLGGLKIDEFAFTYFRAHGQQSVLAVIRCGVSNLMAMGVPKELAIACGSSGKGYWRSAKTEEIHRAISNEFLGNLGLISLRDRWVEIHYG